MKSNSWFHTKTSHGLNVEDAGWWNMRWNVWTKMDETTHVLILDSCLGHANVQMTKNNCWLFLAFHTSLCMQPPLEVLQCMTCEWIGWIIPTSTKIRRICQ